jgi:sec-independent protein translocase protein TatA
MGGAIMIGQLGMPHLIAVLSPPEILVILFICLLIFGPKKLGDLGKGLGEGIRSFKSSLSGNDEPKNPEPAAKSTEAKDTEVKDTEVKDTEVKDTEVKK